MLLNRPTSATVDIVKGIKWTQHCIIEVLSIILDGPKVAAETLC